MAKKKRSVHAARKSSSKSTAKRKAGKQTTSGTRQSRQPRRSRRSGKRTLPDRLSRMTFVLACNLLGERSKELIQAGSQIDEIDIQRDVFLGNDLFRLSLPSCARDGEVPVVTITLKASARNRLHYNCTMCEETCEHVGAAFSLILEEKSLLGLAEPPIEDLPFELLEEDRLIELAISERKARAKTEKFRLTSAAASKPWTDYVVTSAGSGKSYRVALCGEQRGVSYCSCPDFRVNTLGTCKHILYALGRVKTKFNARQRGQKPKRRRFSVHVRYDEHGKLQLSPPSNWEQRSRRGFSSLIGTPTDDAVKLVAAITELEREGHRVVVFPDAEEAIQHRLFQQHIEGLVAEIRKSPADHPLRDSLLKTRLLPYQMDGIAFAVGAGRGDPRRRHGAGQDNPRDRSR